jgi:periplasmic protein TonB
MGHASPVFEEAVAEHTESLHRAPPIRFLSLVVSEPQRATGRKSLTFAVSVVLHTALVIAMAVLPLLFYDVIPEPGGLTAFFVAPLEIAPPPPPPPPPAAVRRSVTRAEPRPQPVAPSAFIAPIEVPEEIKPEEGLELGGVEGGVPGGVEGGVPGGVIGGVVGGLPAEPPPPPRVVRIGGLIVAPKLVRRVDPVYPELAIASRASAMVILEAQVDTRGNVKTVRVLRGHALFDAPAIEAVKQWRYLPLLLNGQPTEFILSVTVMFNLRGPAS